MKFILTLFIGFILLCFLAGFGIATYLGFVPGLSAALGFNKPKDLGITVTASDSLAAQKKIGVMTAPMPAGAPATELYRLEGSKASTYEMDSTEITALFNNRPSKYFPFESVQIRLNEDGTVESSGIIKLDSAVKYIQMLGYSQADIDKAMSEMKIPHMNLPYYVKFAGNVEDNAVTLNIDALTISNIPVPSSYLMKNTPGVEDILENVIKQSPGVSITHLTFSDGRMYYSGMVPEKHYAVTE